MTGDEELLEPLRARALAGDLEAARLVLAQPRKIVIVASGNDDDGTFHCFPANKRPPDPFG
jgi:hypothetical protein